MTQTEIISKLESNAIFALGFAVDNNPDGVVVALKNKGYNLPTNAVSEADKKNWCMSTLKSILAKSKQACIDVIQTVPYNKDATNYTAGFLDYFLRTQPAETKTTAAKFDINALLGGLGSGLSTYVGIAGASETDGIDTQSPAEKAAAEAAAAEAAAAKKKRITTIVIVVVVATVVVTVLVAIFKKKK